MTIPWGLASSFGPLKIEKLLLPPGGAKTLVEVCEEALSSGTLTFVCLAGGDISREGFISSGPEKTLDLDLASWHLLIGFWASGSGVEKTLMCVWPPGGAITLFKQNKSTLMQVYWQSHHELLS